MIVLDWYTKKIVGHYASLRAKTAHWLVALDCAVGRQFPHGSRNHGLHLTSGVHEGLCIVGISQEFMSYNNPKGNAESGRLMWMLKEELLWLRE